MKPAPNSLDSLMSKTCDELVRLLNLNRKLLSALRVAFDDLKVLGLKEGPTWKIIHDALAEAEGRKP